MDTSKIIKGVVNSGRYTVTAPIVKEDYGLYLQIEGVELPQTYEVDFSNSENSGTSVTMIGNADGVLIPRQFIASGKDVFAFLYHVGEDFGRTVYKFRIPNKVRPDRTEETPTPEEQSVIDQAISALNEAVAQTALDVIDADASERMALGYAESAQESARQAQEYSTVAISNANSASQSASQASASATASAQSASQSAQIKADVEDLVDDAQGYAQASAQSATASANSASQAQGYAQSASASAQSASGYASSAQTSAQTASSKASEASGYASTASTKASESAQSASQALTYKNDAESAKTASQTAQGLAESARDTAVSAKTDAEQAKADAESARDEAQQAVASISGALADKAPVITDTASGAIASFSDGADNIPLKSLVIDINPVQDLSHGDPSPENICPISGWTEVDVEQSGKNLLSPNFSDYEEGYNYRYLNNIIPFGRTARFTFTDKDTSIDLSGCYIGFQTGLTPTASTATAYRWAINNGIVQSNTSNMSVYGAVCDGVMIYPKAQETFDKIFSRYNVMVEFGSTTTPYEPYTGRSITIQLGQTVYGGKLDVLSGELVIDRAMVDLGTLNWSYFEQSERFQAALPSKYGGTTRVQILCTKYKANAKVYFDGDRTGGICCTVNSVFVRDFNYTDATTFSAAMDGVQLVYELATPIEIQLSVNQLNSLYGVNNLWADSGDAEVEYRADTKLFIERLTAPDSADMIADANITSGQYFMVGNSLYKATANIANGGQIVVGTNCTRVSLAQALNEINV